MKKFGELVVEEGFATLEQVQTALVHQGMKGGVLGDAMIKLGFITTKQRDYIVNLQMSDMMDKSSS